MKKLLRITLPLLVFLAGTLTAQTVVTVGNQFVTANVMTVPKCAKFWITSGPKRGNVQFLFATGNQITSNLVFRTTRNGISNYYCNVGPGLNNVPIPQVPGSATGATYKAYDSIYSSPDTVAAVWRQMDGFTVTMRMIPEKPATIYDDGTDILLEFEYRFDPFAPPAELGIFMMLDTYNSNTPATGIGGGDRSSLLTDTRYFDASLPGGVYASPIDVIPEWYHVGNFRFEQDRGGQLNTVFPVHRLRGRSHAGVTLNPPNVFAIGNWESFKQTGWAIPSDIGSVQINDCATICRWEGLSGDGVIRTAFGTSDNSGNNHYICRDSNICVVVNTARLSVQAVKNGPYNPAQFDVDAWVVNTDQDQRRLNTTRTFTVRLVSPIQSVPNNTGRLLLDPSTPSSLTMTLAPREVRRIRWRLNVNPNSADTLASLNMRYRLASGVEKVFKQNCAPLVTVIGYQSPAAPKDTVAPVVQRTGTGDNKLPWTFRTFDRHNGYNYDTGLDKIVTEINAGNNFTLSYVPSPFRRCDTSERVNITVKVVDTTKPARIVFAVYDCAGNLTRDSALYAPRPDIFNPEILGIDSSGSYGPPCNTRVYTVWLRDSINQTPLAGDYGFGSVDTVSISNFAPIQINFDKGGAPIVPYDPRASFRLTVLDSMFDASAIIRVADVAGNADTLTFDYCTLPDIRKPVMVAQPAADKKSWTIDGSDTLAWDRGLLTVKALQSVNVNFIPPAITSGDRVTQFNVSVVDDSKDANITLELQDTYYPGAPDGHADTLTLLFTKIPDTLKPNIIFTPVPGTNGSVADVEVNDIHYFGVNKYKYDLGLSTINTAAISPNIRLVTTPNFSPADTLTTFRIQVIDTLAMEPSDSICIQATDLAGNTNTNCYYYPLAPDQYSPIITGALSADRSKLTATVSDSRTYDRGLGVITLENPVNLDLSTLPANVRGLSQSPLTVNVVDPAWPVSGTIVARDFVAISSSNPLGGFAAHESRLPFALPVVYTKLTLPDLVSGGQVITAEVLAASTFSSADVDSFRVGITTAGPVTYSGAQSGAATVRADQLAGGRMNLSFALQPGHVYTVGESLCTLTFNTSVSPYVSQFDLKQVPGSALVNGGVGRVLAEQRATGTPLSALSLPTPYITMTNDSVTYINGTCQSILDGKRKTLKPNVVRILGLRPQPLRTSGGSLLVEMDVKNLPHDARIQVVAQPGIPVDGAVVRIVAATGDLSRVQVALPPGVASGVYFLRISGSGQSDWAKVLVAE